MYIFLSILIVIASLLLIGAVLIQKSKGGGLASDYSAGNQFMGYRKTTDFIEKVTWGLAIFICVVSIFASFAVRPATNVSSMAPAPVQTAAPAPAPTAAPAPKAAPAEKPAAAPEQKAAPAAERQTPAPLPTPQGRPN